MTTASEGGSGSCSASSPSSRISITTGIGTIESTFLGPVCGLDLATKRPFARAAAVSVTSSAKSCENLPGSSLSSVTVASLCPPSARRNGWTVRCHVPDRACSCSVMSGCGRPTEEKGWSRICSAIV